MSKVDWLLASKAMLALCRCKGTGTYEKPCSMCHDSTWDHICDDEQIECKDEKCIALRTAIAEEEARRADRQKNKYNRGSQPCEEFVPSHYDGDDHQCPSCSGLRSFCGRCSTDHHAEGWDFCWKLREQMNPMVTVNSAPAVPSRERLREIAGKWKTSWHRGDGLRPTVGDAIYYALCEAFNILEDEG